MLDGIAALPGFGILYPGTVDTASLYPPLYPPLGVPLSQTEPLGSHLQDLPLPAGAVRFEQGGEEQIRERKQRVAKG